MVMKTDISLNDWLNALVMQRELIIESSPELIHDVQELQRKRHFAGPVAIPQVVAEFAPSQWVSIFPVSLLHDIGIITTPPIPNLVDLSSTWSLYRYIWAFAPQPDGGRLYLSEPAKCIDFHQKGLMSDHMGVGITQWIMSRYFAAERGIDVDVARENAVFKDWLGRRRRGQQSPDYLFPLPHGEYAIVESKGTRSGRGASLTQICRGLEQLQVIPNRRHIRARKFVIGIALSQSLKTTKVYVVEAGEYRPPMEAEETGAVEADLPASHLEPRSREQIFAIQLEINERANAIRAAQLLSYAGAEGGAARILRNQSGANLRPDAPQERHITELDNTFMGQSGVIPIRGLARTAVGVFQGLEAETYNYLLQERFRQQRVGAWRVSPTWQRERARRNLPQGFTGKIVFPGEDASSVFSLASDGSLLQISLLRE